MRIKQLANCSITIRRFDTDENITFEKDTELDVDSATGAYLKSLKIKNKEGSDCANFVEVE